MSVYLLRFDPSYQHAGHSIGFCEDETTDRRFGGISNLCT
jgi:hypothetical protein